jgi:hypothetical protein
MRIRMLDDKTRIRTIDCTMVVSFKKRHSGRLLNIEVDSGDVCDASRKANAYVQKNYPNKGWWEYGVSRATVVERAVTIYGRVPETGRHGVYVEWRKL